MLIVLMIITIIVGVILFITNWDEVIIIPLCAFIIEVIVLLFLLGGLINMRIINDKIELYDKQNKEIEEKIEITVKNYMEYEENAYKDLKSDNYIQLVNLYPDLKADQLVQQQITLYTENNKKIIELKEEKMNETVYKWWIYFGK